MVVACVDINGVKLVPGTNNNAVSVCSLTSGRIVMVFETE